MGIRKLLLFSFLLLLVPILYVAYYYFGSNQITLNSEHPDFTLEKSKNFPDFKKYLNEIGFWRKDAQYDPIKKSSTTAKRLSIILTNIPQTGLNILAGSLEENKLVSSFEYSLNNGEVLMYFHIDPNVAAEAGLEINDIFNTALMRATYLVVENRGPLLEQHLSVADDLVNNRYKEPYVLLKTRSGNTFNFLNILVPKAYAYHAGDCQNWQCGTPVYDYRCTGNPSKFCSRNSDCLPSGWGTCQRRQVSCRAAYWEGHSGSSCISPVCPGSQCVVSGSNHCSCGAPTPPPCSCGSWSNQGCGGGGCPADQRLQTRNCNPDRCYNESRCVADAACAAPPTPTPTPTPSPTPTPTPVPSCTVNLTPDTATVQTGSATTLTTSVTIGSGTITQADFLSGNTGIVTVNPASDSTVVYSTQATGVSVNSTTVRADVIMGGASRCNDTSTVNVTAPGPWWQVVDADVTTNGNLISPIPGSCSLPACNPVFGLRGDGGFPGVPAYGGATADFLSGAGSGRAAESPYNWLANSSYLSSRVYNYAFFERQIPDDVIINELTPPVTGGTFNSGGAPSRGYVWYHWNGATLGDLTITGNVNLVGSRRVVLMAEGANVTINGRIQLQNPGQGFFMMVVGKSPAGLKGDILVGPSVDTIEGIFLAESEFKTGVATSQFNARGSVVAYDGVVLERDLGGANSNTPAEVFTYAPDIIATFPRVFTQRRMRWKEVAP